MILTKETHQNMEDSNSDGVIPCTLDMTMIPNNTPDIK